MYRELLTQFARREGHARVVESHREGNFSLGLWVSKRRTAYRKGLLTPEQIRSLEKVRGWTWSPRDDDFQRGLSVLRAFVRRVGHARVPQSLVERGFHLGAWIASKRDDHRHGRLRPDRARALDAMPGWSWRPRNDDFQAALAALRRFAKREGHARVPYEYSEDGLRLGRWLDAFRRAHARGKVGAERIQLVEELPGWTWHARENLFGKGLLALRAFVRREGHARVPSTHKEKGFRLGLWVANRRNDYRRGKLAPERVRVLAKLAGWSWNRRQTSFEARYRLLARYVQREGHALVPTAHREKGFALGAWVHKCRQKRLVMPPDQARRLRALPGWAWSKHEWQFVRALKVLRAYAHREGHARVPALHVERGLRLGAWVSHCRARRAGLSRERRRGLEAVHGWAWSVDARPSGLRVPSQKRRLRHLEREALAAGRPRTSIASRRLGR